MTKVLFLGGTGRTGSTLIDRVLGSCPGWLSGGELAFFWRYGILGGGLCSCGNPVQSCPLWSESLRLAEIDQPIDPLKMVELRRRFWSIHLPLMAFDSFSRSRLAETREFPEAVSRLYSAALEISGNRILIDSSKDAHYSYLMREGSDLDIYFLHLVRDPRAVGHSWRKKKSEAGFGGRADMERRGTLKTSVYYTVSDLAAEVMWKERRDRYRLLRYEDFVSDPLRACSEISDFVGEDINLSSVLNGDIFTPSPGHVTWGNPNRFDTSPVRIKPDEAWRSEQQEWRSFLLGLLNAPVARHYGYRIGKRSKIARVGRKFDESVVMCR